MDAREATLKARRYFEEVKEMQPLSFDIESATLDKDIWEIRCSFYRNPLDPKRVVYTVKVRDKDGFIVSAAQLLPTKTSGDHDKHTSA